MELESRDRSSPIYLKAASESMWPLVKVHDILEVDVLRETELKPFDLAVYKNGDRLICHVYRGTRSHPRTKATYILTQSLRNSRDVVAVPLEDVRGRVLNRRLTLLQRTKLCVFGWRYGIFWSSSVRIP